MVGTDRRGENHVADYRNRLGLAHSQAGFSRTLVGMFFHHGGAKREIAALNMPVHYSDTRRSRSAMAKIERILVARLFFG